MTLAEFSQKNALFRLAARLYTHFDTIPAGIRIENYRFYIIANIAYTTCAAIHIAWLTVFFYIGQYTLMQIQLLSIGLHVLAINLNRRGIMTAAMLVAIFEVVAHQILAVYLLGWGAGFQYLLAVITVFPFLMQNGNMLLKLALFLIGMGSFLFLNLAVKDHAPLYSISNAAMHGFNYSNVVLLFVLTAFWGFFINLAVVRTEKILSEKTQELFTAEKAAEQAEMRRALEVKERDNEIFRLRNVELKHSHDAIEEEKRKSEELLRNILPEETANELLREGKAKSRRYDMVTVMFMDFAGFTGIAERMSAEELVHRIDEHFQAFDEITMRHGVEKIKTIGDAYMCAGGLPAPNTTNPSDVLNAALDIQAYMNGHNSDHLFNLRIGVHTGAVVAGVVGKHKFQYDIWGDAVNVAARMEQAGAPGMINISGETYRLAGDKFVCQYRGKISAKNKGELDMYFVTGKPGNA